MLSRANPFLGRSSESTTSDQEFVQLFAPKILERVPDAAFLGGLHIFSSPPGGGKTTLLRAFSPSSLRAFWNSRKSEEYNESYFALVDKDVIDKLHGPKLLGVMLSCASGFADIPPGATWSGDNLFRALFDCRVVLRSLRNLAISLGRASTDALADVLLDYTDTNGDFSAIPRLKEPGELVKWAEMREREVYTLLDSVEDKKQGESSGHLRFESVLWLQSVRFLIAGEAIAPKRLLMIDDLHRLRKQQRALLISELAELRPNFPVWLAQRTIALGGELIAQGVRRERDVNWFDWDDLWLAGKSTQFQSFVLNILDRRIANQSTIPIATFASSLREDLETNELTQQYLKGPVAFEESVGALRPSDRFSEWFTRAQVLCEQRTYDALRDLFVIAILIAREHKNKQMSLELLPLPTEAISERAGSDLRGAAEIFLHEEVQAPYYFGVERICSLASGNVEEALSLAAGIYEALLAKHIVRRSEIVLSPAEQERAVLSVAKRKREFIPKSHSEGARAQRLIDAIGKFCQDRTFEPTAPYAPGATGIRLSDIELSRIQESESSPNNPFGALRAVLVECVAENLLLMRKSSATSGRDSGHVFYLNRSLCCYFGLPLQFGGWNEVTAIDLVEWMGSGRPTSRKKSTTVNA